MKNNSFFADVMIEKTVLSVKKFKEWNKKIIFNRGLMFLDACIYSNLSSKIFLRACLFCLDPDCCKNRFHPGTCVYSNLEIKPLLQQSRGLRCYSNMVGMSSKPEIDQN